MGSFFENEIAYLQSYCEESDSAVFLQNNPVPWRSAHWARQIAVWALEHGNAPLVEHVVQTVPMSTAAFVLNELFKHREHNPHNIEHAQTILNRHPINTDAVLLNCSRHLEAEWMVLFAPGASNTVAIKAYGTILHYITPRSIGLNMWGNPIVNRFFGEHIEHLLSDAVVHDPNGNVRWAAVLEEHNPTCELSQRISALLQNKRLHNEIHNPVAPKMGRKI